ncbi:MAG: hypothetical protein KA248_09735 [Kiritimatiellae bacterium]|nr:hypothetical protein [Kiritimatiellia bacterium]
MKSSKPWKTGAFVFPIIGNLLFAGAAPAQTTHYVVPVNPGAAPPFTSWATAATNIQDAVDACAPGDTVLLTNGTYYTPDWTWVTNAVTVTSVNGPAVTIVDRQGDDEGCFWISHSNAVVERLSLTGGGFEEGGGAYIEYAGTLRDCWVYENYAFSGGAGVYLYEGGVVSNCNIWYNWTGNDGGGVLCRAGGEVVNSTIHENLAYGWGGGMHITDGGTARHCQVYWNAARFGGGINVEEGLVESCTIVSNSNFTISFTSCGGGGIQIDRDSVVRDCFIGFNLVTNNNAAGGGARLRGSATLENCVVTGNVVWGNSSRGAGVSVENDDNLVLNCRIVNNEARSSGNYGGGGLFFTTADDSYARNCLVAGNVVTGYTSASYAYGAGVLFYDGGILQNCTVVSNQLIGLGGGGGIHHTSRGVVENCVVQYNYDDAFLQNHLGTANGAWRYSCTTSLVAGVGNTDADPLFADPGAANFRLTDSSPCVNTGLNDPWMGGETDLDGNPRIRVGIVDMGAFEHYPTALQCTLLGGPRSGWDQLAVVFTGFVGGADAAITYYGWDFDDDGAPDLEGPGLAVVTNVYDPGFYDVSLVVSNGSGARAAFRQADYIRVYPSVVHVAPGGTPVFPYATWATAATNPADTTAATRDGSTVLVSNGVYVLTAQVVISNSVLFQSVNGPTVTVFNGNGAVRAFSLSSTGAVVSGFMITNSVATSGGGVYMSAGLVQNCWVISNRATAGGSAGGGVRMTGGTLRNCLVVGNRAPSTSAAQGGGVSAASGAVIENCTVVRNSAYSNAGGIQGGTVVNCIVLFNTASFDPNYLSIAATHTCSTPLPGGTGNFTNNPQFVATNDYRLTAASPCRDAGTNLAWMAGAADLDGSPRLFNTLVDVGCYEYRSDALTCTFQGAPTAGRAPLTVVFNGFADGLETNINYYGWDFDGDGVADLSGAGRHSATTTYSSAQYYTVQLAVSNTAGETAVFTRPQYIRVEPLVLYVSPGGSHTPPYSTWAMAATSIHAALSVAGTGTLVLVTNGIYVITNSVRVTNSVTLRGVNGPEVTIMDASNKVQCVLITHAQAVVDGFTIMRGKTDALGEGAGVKMTAGLLQNCIVVSNTACSGSASRGGGIYALNAIIRNCLIRDNSVTCGNAFGGGVYGWNTVVEQCTIVSNRAVYGGGMYWDGVASVRNSIVFGNIGTTSSSNWNSGTFLFTCADPLPPGAGNIDLDPLFAAADAGDYHLQAGSPCVDTGTNLPAVAVDLDGVPRPLDGNHDGAAAWDMGAYERAHPDADSDGDGLKDTNELAIGTSPVRADSDGDRSSDGEEIRAGTDPLDALSVFELVGVRVQVSGSVVRWSSVAGKQYDLSRSANLQGVFEGVFTNLPATPPLNVHTDQTAAGAGPWLYRVETE